MSSVVEKNKKDTTTTVSQGIKIEQTNEIENSYHCREFDIEKYNTCKKCIYACVHWKKRICTVRGEKVGDI